MIDTEYRQYTIQIAITTCFTNYLLIKLRRLTPELTHYLYVLSQSAVSLRPN